jgi:glucoamylase
MPRWYRTCAHGAQPLAEITPMTYMDEECQNPAPNGPGDEPTWTRSSKDLIGTAYSTSSRVWFTVLDGVLTEVYYPTIDKPQLRDLQLLITDGETFIQEERLLPYELEPLSSHALGARITRRDPEGRFSIHKEIITDPHTSSVLIHAKLEASEEWRPRLKIYALCAPHLERGGWGNNAKVVDVNGHKLFCVDKEGEGGDHTWMAYGSSRSFVRASCGYVGVNDGWTDLSDNYTLDWEYDCATDGNIALTGEIEGGEEGEFTLALAFGTTFHAAITTLFQSLGTPFEQLRERFVEQWTRACDDLMPLEGVAGDGGSLYHRSISLLLAHEDKTYQGAMIASLSIPWGEVKGDSDGLGGYHLVWTRDLVQAAMGLLALGDRELALRALIYLAVSQRPDGGFNQNFWLDGEANFTGVQLDEVAFPILLAWRLKQLDALGEFDPYEMVRTAARFLIVRGPATPQERWEENSGYSPSTLASNIAALICAAGFAEERGDAEAAEYMRSYAYFLEGHIEAWTVTTEGTLHPEVKRHYIRIHPVEPNDPHADENPNAGTVRIANRGPDEQAEFPANEVVDGGFLELVRYGIREADDPLIADTLKVIDAVLKVDFPQGPSWRRYNHDGYGQRHDGTPYREGWGQGRPWPLLTGERGHYELAAGRSAEPYIRAIEGFAHGAGLLPEQVWDGDDMPDKGLHKDAPAGSAMPLVWAHAEYVKLLRSATDGRVFDLIPEVAARYIENREERTPLEVWKFNRQVGAVRRGHTLRVQAPARFTLRWSPDGWNTSEEREATHTSLGISYVDFETGELPGPVTFTFHWLDAGKWEGRDYTVEIVEGE